MANNITNGFILNFTGTEDTTQNVPINRGINVSFDSIVGEFTAYHKISGATGIGFPGITIAYQIYVRNLDTVNQVTVTVTPVSGAPIAIAVLNPGGTDFVLLCTKSGGAANAGWSTLQLTPVAGTALVEYFIGG